MGVGILVIVVGVSVGAFMAAAPKRMWWVTESWKFKDPEANEPSDTAYGLTRTAGVFVSIVALCLGGSLISDDRDAKQRHEAQEKQRAAEAAFVVPPPENRGPLPVVGYFAKKFPKGLEITVYYLAPRDSVREAVRDSASHRPIKSSYPCYTSAGRASAKGTPPVVNPELIWAPGKLGDLAKSDSCRPGVGRKVHETSRFLGSSSELPVVVTDSAIVDRSGTEILPAASGNVVPKLPERMYPDP